MPTAPCTFSQGAETWKDAMKETALTAYLPVTTAALFAAPVVTAFDEAAVIERHRDQLRLEGEALVSEQARP